MIHAPEAADLFREIFETDCEVFFVFNGTAANSLAISALCRSYHSVICHETAHIETDECGAPEFFSNGTKILLATGPDTEISIPRDRIQTAAPSKTSLMLPGIHLILTPQELSDLITFLENTRWR